MRTITQLKIFFAGVLIALAMLTTMTAPAQVMGRGQFKSPAAVGLPDASESARALHPVLPGVGISKRATIPGDVVLAPPTLQGSSVSFLPVVTYDSGGQSFSVAVADLNGDGKPDLVVANAGFAEGSIGVLLGRGDGTFKPVVSYNSGGDIAYSVAVADVNGDGKPDLLVADCGSIGINACNHSNGLVGVLLGNGDGTFRPVVTYDSGGSSAVSIGVADVNADGRPDVLVANECGTSSICQSGSVGVLLGNGDGTFQAAKTYDAKYAVDSIAVADVNGDGRPDLLAANNNNNTVGVLLGKGDGTFQPVVTYSSGGNSPLSVAVADVNGDGKPDLLVANMCDTSGNCAHGSVSVLLGNGDGTFQPAVSYDPGGTGAWSVKVADVNGDGKPDLVVALYFYHSVGVLLGNGDGTFQAATTYDSGGIVPMSVAVADLNADGKPDVAVSNFCASNINCLSGKVGVLLNNTTLFRSTTSTSFVSSLNPSIYGQKVTWTAKVTSSGGVTPTGKVNFMWSIYTIGSATLNASGVATLTKSNLNADLYPLTAVYSGDVNNLRSTSAIVNQVVTETTSAAKITSTPNPSTLGQAVTFTATITSPTVIPTGPVTFMVGTKVLGTAQLSSGKAKFTTSTLPVGSTKVTATYYGDSNIAKSSASVIQTVH
jgi:Bacterial Ig-like domain (group 3)/FG-GAP-like repeat